MQTKRIRITGACRLLAVFFAAFAAAATQAAQLTGIAWEDDAVRVRLDGEAAFATQARDGGLRVRVTFSGATLSPKVTELKGRGAIKGVFPFVGDEGHAVLEFLLHKAQPLQVQAAEGGYIIRTAAGGGAPLLGPGAEKAAVAAEAEAPAGNALEDVSFTELAGNRIQIRLKMAREPDEPATFSISKPARVAIDFFNTRNAFGNKTVSVGQGAVESISVIEADGRTRLVLNLIRPVDYSTDIRPDGMLITVESPVVGIARAEKPKTTRFAKAPKKAAKYSVQHVDFRRGKDGAGKLMITLSDTAVGIDIREEAGEIIVDFINTTVPTSLERRLDVVDFATPVQLIDTFQHGDDVRVAIKAAGRYEHIAYQAGNVFTVSVKPITKEEERKPDEFGYKGERLSLNFQNIPVRSALQVIADFTDINFVTSDSVKGNLTLRLKDVPWDQALDIILRAKGLAMRRHGNVIWVAPAEEIAAKEKQQLEASKAVTELEPLVSELIQINYAKAADIAELLKSIRAVSPQIQPQPFTTVTVSQFETETNTLLSPRGNVTVDERTNSILIQDTAAKIREIKKLIAKLDKPVRQVMIETRIVQADEDFSRSLGARFGVVNRNRSFNIPGASNTDAGDAILLGRIEGAEDIYNEDTYPLAGPGLQVDLASPGIENRPAGSVAFTLFKTLATHLIQLELSALEAEGRGKIIASPRLVTANQQEARIEQGQERIFPPTGFATQPTIVEAKLSLTVTPQITPEDSVILDIEIQQDAFVAPADPTINTKRVRTQILLRNGETVVIGGIYQEQVNDDVFKVPLLGDLPFVGALFRNKERRTEKRELLIFLTPRILSPALKLAEG